MVVVVAVVVVVLPNINSMPVSALISGVKLMFVSAANSKVMLQFSNQLPLTSYTTPPAAPLSGATFTNALLYGVRVY